MDEVGENCFSQYRQETAEKQQKNRAFLFFYCLFY